VKRSEDEAQSVLSRESICGGREAVGELAGLSVFLTEEVGDEGRIDGAEDRAYL
jgi:hypothetical protein